MPLPISADSAGRFAQPSPRASSGIPKSRHPAELVLPYYELRNKLGMEGKSPDEIASAVQAAYASGAIPKRATVGFAYMWSADQTLGPAGHLGICT